VPTPNRVNFARRPNALGHTKKNIWLSGSAFTNAPSRPSTSKRDRSASSNCVTSPIASLHPNRVPPVSLLRYGFAQSPCLPK
jgi:hypothetical protein